MNGIIFPHEKGFHANILLILYYYVVFNYGTIKVIIHSLVKWVNTLLINMELYVFPCNEWIWNTRTFSFTHSTYDVYFQLVQQKKKNLLLEQHETKTQKILVKWKVDTDFGLAALEEKQFTKNSIRENTRMEISNQYT